MIEFTDAAIEHAKKVMKGAALRLSVQGGGCSGYQYAMASDNGPARPTDQVHHFGELTVHVDGISASFLDGVTVDFVETLESSGFKFNNPKATRTCGCGSSFSA
jgi:iron-sulfur cluster assembly protein